MTKEEHGERFRWFDTRTTLEAMSRTYTLEPTSNRRSFVGTDSEGDGIRVALPGFFPIPTDCSSLGSYLDWLPAELPRSCIILLRSGYAAVALCSGAGIERAKVVRRYTVRKKQGGAQTRRQSKKPAKSVGARLRMRESDGLWVDLAQVLGAWSADINQCDLIFLGSTPQLKGELFASPVKTVLRRQDPRILPLGLPYAQPSKLVLEKAYRELAMGYWVIRPNES